MHTIPSFCNWIPFFANKCLLSATAIFFLQRIKTKFTFYAKQWLFFSASDEIFFLMHYTQLHESFFYSLICCLYLQRANRESATLLWFTVLNLQLRTFLDAKGCRCNAQQLRMERITHHTALCNMHQRQSICIKF